MIKCDDYNAQDCHFPPLKLEDDWDFGFPREILNSSTLMGKGYRGIASYACDVIQGFPWNETEEGFSFWSDVAVRLMRIGRIGR